MDLKSDTVQDIEGSEPSSPLKSMSITTDTLSLTQSHLTNSYPDSRLMVNEYQKSIGSIGSAHSRHIREFVPYPPDIISTTVERRSGTDWGYQSKTPLISHQKSHKFGRNGNKTKLKRMSSHDSVSTNDCSQDYNGFDRESIISVQSICSGIESNDSNDMNVFGIDGNETIKEYKNIFTETDKTEMTSQYSQASITDDTTGPLFELKRNNSQLSGKLETINQIMEDMVKERSELQMKLHSMEKEIKVKNERIDEMNAERERLLADSEELKSGISKWESIVGEYQEVVDAKTHEIQALNEDINKMSENNETLRINCEHLKIDLQSKDNSIKQLNKTVSQMNGEIDSLIHSKVSLEEEVKRKRTEVEAISTQKEWFELELNKLQVRLNETHQKLVSEQQISIGARNECERYQTLNSVLKEQSIEVKYKAVKEKELLMRHLEGIGLDLVQKEAQNQLVFNQNDETVSVNKTYELSEDFKQKLYEKNIQIENLSRDLKQLNETNQRLVKEQELMANNVNSMKRQSTDRDHEMQTLKSYSSDLEFKIRGLNIELKRHKELNEILRKDKKSSESKLNSLTIDNKSLESATKQLKETIEKYERSLKQLQSNLIAKETKLELQDKEKSKLLNTIQMKEQELAQMTRSLNIDTTNANELNLFELRIQNQELEKVMNTMNTEMRTNQIRADEQKNQLLRESSELQIRLSELDNKYESLKNEKNGDSLGVNELKEKLKISENKVIELQTEINSLNNNNIKNKSENYIKFEANDELIGLKNEKIRSLESNVKLLTKKYREVIESKKEIETKLENMNQKTAIVTKNLVSTQTEDLSEKCDNNSKLMDENEELKQEIERLKEDIRCKNGIIDENQKIILSLEHEKGKLSSAGQNSTNQHIMALEVLIASKSEEVMQLSDTLREKNKEFKEMEIKLNKKLSETETELKKEKAIVKDLRHSVFTEKRENSYHKKDLNQLKKALTETNAIADKRRQEVIDIENEIKSHKEMESSLRNQIERITSEMISVKEENSKLKVKIDSSVHKNEPLLEQLKNLSLNLMEKNQEMEGMKAQFNYIKERNEREIHGLRQQIERNKSNEELMTTELNELRKSKFGLQSRLTELRVVLKNSYEQNKKLRQQLNNSPDVVTQEYDFNEELVTKLLDQSIENTKEIKPLVNLKTCVQSLKQEMELLQKQISDHNHNHNN